MLLKASAWGVGPYADRGETMKNTVFDILVALVVAALLLVGALAYFDILTKG